MKAVVRRGKQLVETDYQNIEPGPGQVLVSTLACGICGSDLHALHGLDDMVASRRRTDTPSTIDPSQDLVMGHEFCAEILDYGVDCERRFKPGTRVVSVPYAIGPAGRELVGFSNRFPGGFAERMVLTESMLLEVPNGLSSEHAAMTEPMSVGAHAVAAADLSERSVALVIGCGPVGLAVIAALKCKNVAPIIACDFSPGRRAIAEQFGADILIDPAQNSPHGLWNQFDVPATLAELTRAEMSERQLRNAVIFQCVGAPGLLQSTIEQVPPLAQIVVVGACAQPDPIVPVLALHKQLRFNFVFAYTPREFAATLHQIAEGQIDVEPLISRVVGRSGVASAFADLAQPGDTAKIVVDPRRA
jgi:threonine dehydrogenase-like Zn-dependent dehydrogenase